jgi:L-fuconolactonase
MIIDAHQHVWDLSRGCYDWIGPELGAINRTFTQEQALPLMRRAGVSGVVLVQAADHRTDTDDMLRTAARHPEVVGVVAFVPLDDPAEVSRELARLTEDPVVVGVRQLIHDLPDPDYLLRDDVNESLQLVSDAGLAFDVVSALPRHLEHVPVLAERHPGLRIVIDHLSRPPIGGGSHEPWWSLIELRALPRRRPQRLVAGADPSLLRTGAGRVRTTAPDVGQRLAGLGAGRRLPARLRGPRPAVRGTRPGRPGRAPRRHRGPGLPTGCLSPQCGRAGYVEA